LLRGSLRRQADQVRFGFTLLEMATGSVVWSETFDYDLSSASLFDIQEQVASRIASRVLDPHGVLYRSLKRQPAALLGTYLAVFRYHEYEERFTPEIHRRVREELERSIQEEPGYAEAWAALANVYLGEALFASTGPSPFPP
jgi:adenylate cyclase